jgi:hypothetical protein
LQGVAIKVKEAKRQIGSVYVGAIAGCPVNQPIRCQFLICEQHRVSGDSKRRGKPPG